MHRNMRKAIQRTKTVYGRKLFDSEVSKYDSEGSTVSNEGSMYRACGGTMALGTVAAGRLLR